ncbi:MAG: hypothetical protein ACPG4X_03275 [Pikeienuella sp.]
MTGTVLAVAVLTGCVQFKFTGLESLRHRACIAETGLPCED